MNTARITLLILAAAGVAACSRQEQLREIDWARDALARNPQFEIVATDEKAGVFTVRETDSGAIRTLRLEELVAAPLPAAGADTTASGQVGTAPAIEPEAPPTAEPEAATPEVASNQPVIPFVDEPPTGPSLAEGPGYSITRGTAEAPARPAATLEGPGYRIERQAGAAPAAAATPARFANAEQRAEPIICQGNRQMHIDGQTIEFAGDALIAERGCDLYITNARIRAGGVGIIARDQARVHVVNSTIDGSRASYEASEGGAIYLARSTVQGVGRQFAGGTMTDLGGNSWRTR